MINFMAPRNSSLIPSRLNARFAPPTPIPQPQKFGYNIPIPQPPVQPQQQMGMVPPEPPPNFADEYAKIQSNRPARLAYQESTQQGSPEIQRGKWAKLGALIAAGGSALGGMPADRAAQLGISSYMQPQYRSDERFQQKSKGLEKLAGMEETDIQNQIQQLEAQRRDYYDRENLALKRTDTERQGKLTDAQLKNIDDEMSRRDLKEYTDPTTGISFRKNLKTGVVEQIGKTGETPSELAEKARLETEAKEKALEPGRKARDVADYNQAMAVAREGTTRAQGVAETQAKGKVDAVLARMNNLGSQLKPDEKVTQVWYDMMGTIANETDTFKNMGVPSDYVDVEGLGTANAIVKVKESSRWDSAEDVRIKDRLREIIAASYNKNNAPAGRSQGAAPPAAGTTSSGRKYEIIK